MRMTHHDTVATGGIVACCLLALQRIHAAPVKICCCTVAYAILHPQGSIQRACQQFATHLLGNVAVVVHGTYQESAVDNALM